jgi:hypothetical protein
MKNMVKNIEEKIKILESSSLQELSVDDIRTNLYKSTGLPYNIFPYIAGSRIFRGQVSEVNPFDQVSRLSYNPNPATKLGRANLVGESVFYAAGSIDNAAIEACQDDLRNSDESVFYITIGEWKLNRDIEINLICHSDKAQSTGTDIPVAIESLESKMRENRTEEEYNTLLKKNIFFANQFAKENIENHKDYAYSAIYSSQLLHNGERICDGICFPSVAYKLVGFNFVFQKDLFDNGDFEFVAAHFLKLTFENKEKYPKIERLKMSENIVNGTINW